jgi:protein-serine/threonine kinase
VAMEKSRSASSSTSNTAGPIAMEKSRSASSPLTILSNKLRKSSISRSHQETDNDYLRRSSVSSNSSSMGSSFSSTLSMFSSSLRSSGVLFSHKRSDSTDSLEEKYGRCDKKSLGKGANSVVRLSHKKEISTSGECCERLYAVKEFRKRHDSESAREYIKKVTSEFCISSSLHHENVIETVDLIVCVFNF